VPPTSVELKKQVKAANDIIDVISTYIPVHPAGKIFKALCPFHDDTRPSLQIDRHWQNYICWACQARGDVFDFVMKFEKVEFPEALRILAERAGIRLTPQELSSEDQARGRLLDAMRWAEAKYQACYFDDPVAADARAYIGGRSLSGATVRRFGLGFAPLAGDWLVQLAARDRMSPDVLVEVGLIAPRDEGRGYYDRFRDRVMFPIRDVRGRTVGFGGRVLPSSPLAARSPKYYNSADTPLFTKSDLLYGLDLARHPGSQAGFLAVVEGYTDVMMAHQCGVENVVATMGTALNARHVTQLRRYAPKVVLVFDADAGGQTGVDRALELFVSQDVELAIATLPEGLDPCDLLVRAGGLEAFRNSLTGAADALEFKLNQLLARESASSIEGAKRVMDGVLAIMALAPPIPSQAVQVRIELIVTRIAHRLGLRQETVWARFGELKRERRRKDPAPPPTKQAAAGPPPTLEKQLLQLLLAEPALVSAAAAKLNPEILSHTGLRRMLSELYALHAAGQTPDLDALRVKLIDRPDLAAVALDLQFTGRHMTDRPEWLKRVLDRFAEQQAEAEKRALKEQLAAGSADDERAVELLRRLQARTAAPSEN
jgi:DNA primase